MKKNYIALAVGTAFVSGTAFAGTGSITAPTAGQQSVPAEYFTAATVASPSITHRYTTATEFAQSAAINVVYTLSNGIFSSAPTLAVANGGGDATDSSTISLVSGGDNSSTVTFRITDTGDTAANGIDAGDHFDLSFAVDGLTALATDGAEMEVSVALTDNIGTWDTAVTTDVLVSNDVFSTSVTADVTTNTNIDVGQSSTQFIVGTANTKTVPLGNVQNTVSTTPAGSLELDDLTTAVAFNANNAILTSITVTVDALTGGFGAYVGTDTNNTVTNEGVYIDLDGGNSFTAGEEADTLTASQATWTLTGAQVTALGVSADNGQVYVVADGSTTIDPSTFSVTVAANYTDSATLDESFTGSFRSLEKNGSSATANYVLTPGGAFEQYFKITNTSGVSGDVSITMYNEAGTAATFALSAVEDISTSTLVGNASSPLITLTQLADAAVTANSAFLTGDAADDKLRLVVEGEFPSIDLDSVSLDANGFEMTTN